MRRRCNGAPIKWLGGVLLVAAGAGMVFACLLPACAFLVGVGMICGGVWLVKQR